MIKLSKQLPKEPFWIDLLYGVRWKVRPFTTAIGEAAGARSASMLAKLREEIRDIRESGGEVTGLPDLDDEDEATGLARQYYYQSLAVSALVEWEGVEDEETTDPAPYTRENLLLLTGVLPRLLQEFVIKYTAPYDRMIAEGNGLPAVLTGISGQGAAGNTAPTVAASATPAPEEHLEKMAGAVPT